MVPGNLREIADRFTETIPKLAEELARLVRAVPAGRVVSYGDLATALGDVVASRWVATVLLEPEGTLRDFSHRVVRTTGELGLYAGGDLAEKERRLAEEGVSVQRGKVDLGAHRAELPTIVPPLGRLKTWQQHFEMPEAPPLQLSDVRQVGGVDVSYAGDTAVAVCTRFDSQMQFLGHFVHRQPVRFPYVSGYLSFREIPVYLEMLARLQEKEQLPDVLLVDGNGRLHPRRCGIASMLGAVAGIPTIGVAKKLLHGMVVEKEITVGVPRQIVPRVSVRDETLGYAILPSAKTKHPIYVSQGFAVEDETMLALVLKSLMGHRSPEPIYLADRLSRQFASKQEPSE